MLNKALNLFMYTLSWDKMALHAYMTMAFCQIGGKNSKGKFHHISAKKIGRDPRGRRPLAGCRGSAPVGGFRGAKPPERFCILGI